DELLDPCRRAGLGHGRATLPTATEAVRDRAGRLELLETRVDRARLAGPQCSGAASSSNVIFARFESALALTREVESVVPQRVERPGDIRALDCAARCVAIRREMKSRTGRRDLRDLT